MLNENVKSMLRAAASSKAAITVLTGAGISAESGIPTFRGPEGYWTVGSRNYQPEEMGTVAMFRKAAREVWKWYIYRRSVCRRADPNQGHHALAAMEQLLGDRFMLISQNVDGLHSRAGNTSRHSFLIHGNLDLMRCAAGCCDELFPMPEGLPALERNDDLNRDQWELLQCPRCFGLTRPHVLWFDEYYDERWYRYDSSLVVARKTDVLIVVGTSGATSLPHQIVMTVLDRGAVLVDVNIERDIFAAMAEESGKGFFIRGSSSEILPQILAELERGIE